MFSFFRRQNTGRARQRHAAPKCRPTLEVLEDRTLMDGSLSALALIGSGGDGGGQTPPPLVFTGPVGQSGKVFVTVEVTRIFETVSATEQITFRFGNLSVTYQPQAVHNENSLGAVVAQFLGTGSTIPGPPGLLVAADIISPHSKGT
jgi:hypothetical protein